MPRLLLILQSLCNAQNLLEGHSLSELSPSLCVIGANASPAKIAFPQLRRWPSTRSVSHCKWSFPWYLAASQWRNAGPSFCICLLSTMIAYCWRKTQMQSKYMWQHRLHSVSSPTHYSSISLTTQLSAYAESKSLCSRLGRPLTHSCRCLLSPWPQQSAVIIILPKEESERNQPPRDDMIWYRYDTGRFKNDCKRQPDPPPRLFGCHLEGLFQGNPTNTRPRNYIIKRQVRNL